MPLCWMDCTATTTVTGKTKRAMVTGKRTPDHQPTLTTQKLVTYRVVPHGVVGTAPRISLANRKLLH
jgi:hypothetical protein